MGVETTNQCISSNENRRETLSSEALGISQEAQRHARRPSAAKLPLHKVAEKRMILVVDITLVTLQVMTNMWKMDH